MRNSVAYTHQTMKELFRRVTIDAQRHKADDPSAYIVSTLAACLNVVFLALAEKSEMTEMDMVRDKIERVVNISSTLTEDTQSESE